MSVQFEGCRGVEMHTRKYTLYICEVQGVEKASGIYTQISRIKREDGS